MSALPSNLALVGDDLARATRATARALAQAAARSSRSRLHFALLVADRDGRRRQRLAPRPDHDAARGPALGPGQSGAGPAPGAAASAIGELAKTAAKHRAASPDSARAPELGSAVAGTSRTLLTDLGPQERVLSSVATTTGGVCLAAHRLSGAVHPDVHDRAGRRLVRRRPRGTGTTLIWGIARDDVDEQSKRFLTTTRRRLPPSSATTRSTSTWAPRRRHASSLHLSDGTRNRRTRPLPTHDARLQSIERPQTYDDRTQRCPRGTARHLFTPPRRSRCWRASPQGCAPPALRAGLDEQRVVELLAEQGLEITVDTVSRWEESGLLHVDAAVHLADAYGTTIDALAGRRSVPLAQSDRRPSPRTAGAPGRCATTSRRHDEHPASRPQRARARVCRTAIESAGYVREPTITSQLLTRRLVMSAYIDSEDAGAAMAIARSPCC